MGYIADIQLIAIWDHGVACTNQGEINVMIFPEASVGYIGQ